MANVRKKKLVKKYDQILKVLFVLYLLALVKVLLFRYVSPLDLFRGLSGERVFNYIPFKTIFDLVTKDEFGFGTFLLNILGNFLLFVPMGMFLSAFFKNKKPFRTAGLVLCTSVAFELLQYGLKLGIADIDDVLLNTLGGAAGIYLFHIIVHKYKTKVKVSLASVVCLAIMGVLGIGTAFSGIADGMTLRLFFSERIIIKGQEFFIDTEKADIFGYFVSMEDDVLLVKNISKSLNEAENLGLNTNSENEDLDVQNEPGAAGEADGDNENGQSPNPDAGGETDTPETDSGTDGGSGANGEGGNADGESGNENGSAVPEGGANGGADNSDESEPKDNGPKTIGNPQYYEQDYISAKVAEGTKVSMRTIDPNMKGNDVLWEFEAYDIGKLKFEFDGYEPETLKVLYDNLDTNHIPDDINLVISFSLRAVENGYEAYDICITKTLPLEEE